MAASLDESSDTSTSMEDGNDKSLEQISKANALSLTFMKSFSGLCCDGCDNDPFKSIGQHKQVNGEMPGGNRTNGADNSAEILEDITAISHLVARPMVAENLDSHQPGVIETVIGECKYCLL